MINLLVFSALAVFYFWSKESEISPIEAFVALGFYGIYILVYLFMPPFATATSSKMGLLYGLVPAVSVCAVLFPHFNQQSPEIVTRCLGWAGLVLVFIILMSFKLFVW
ncbi:hypothetical protein [Shewanella pneumatophori]|uniref:Uncharacterized protein n=1 Tax=Shewanella pneumatophori TaxID=314092 RepID=A0A9X1ZDJ2_9GAMM|nr:hypothetical protein [Shewanella pneumatophori]MCL1139032.1 hypothetical protein [Shewanella pneumatophori]